MRTFKINSKKKENFKERIWFIKYWANFIKTHPDKEWSKGQAILIDSQFQSARYFYKSLENNSEGRKILKQILKLKI
ncbi:MAG TPA: hypothetical protein VJ208_01155 [Candidatus Nanoarchaeia archaeon]|nr:hypothetical protein [Candidatus Nanoarchaeia archaeon]